MLTNSKNKSRQIRKNKINNKMSLETLKKEKQEIAILIIILSNYQQINNK